MMAEITKTDEKIIEKEVKKRLAARMYSRTKESATKFKNEFKTHTLTAITAAFAFLIALSWREPIQLSVDSIVARLGLSGEGIFLKYVAALIITIIAVLILISVSRWSAKKE